MSFEKRKSSPSPPFLTDAKNHDLLLVTLALVLVWFGNCTQDKKEKVKYQSKVLQDPKAKQINH